MDSSVDWNEGALISLLQQCQDEIARQLERQQILKTSLERKLAIARRLKAPVSRLPKELLLMIFFELVREDPKAIAPILFVCRHWSNIATNSTMLWSKTLARFPTDIAGIKREGDYLKTAIRCGGNTPLYVDIRLPSLDDLWERLAQSIFEPACDYSQEWLEARIMKPMRDLNQVKEWFNDAVVNQPFYDSVYMMRVTPCTYVDLAIYAELFSVADAIKGQVSRLHSITLYFYSGQFISWLSYGGFNIFYGPTPMLEELTVVESYEPQQGAMSHPVDVFFLHPIPSLIRLSWRVGWPVKAILSPTGRLTHLQFGFYRDYTDFPPDEYTSTITHLFLEFPYVLWPWDGPPFFLPNLEDLTIKNDIPLNFIKVPRLTTLRLMDSYATDARYNHSPEFPYLEKLHVHDVSDAKIKHLKTYINHLPCLTEVGVLFYEEVCMQDWMKELKERGISLKAYRRPPDDKIWNFDYEFYITNEIPFEF